MRAFVFGLLGVLVGAGLVAGLLLGVPLLRAGVAGPPHHTADEVLAAFRDAGLRVESPGALSDNGGARYTAAPYNVKKGKSFTVGVVPAVPFFVMEFDSVAEREAVGRQLASNRSSQAPRYYARDNIILLTYSNSAELATRYETVLAGLR